MSEFAELAWGIAEIKRDLQNVVETATSSTSPVLAMEALRSLVLSRPDAGLLRTDSEFLMRFLRARKMNAEDAFEVYVNFYRFRHNNPELFVGNAIGNAEVREAIEDGLPGVLQRRDVRGRRIMVLFAAQWDPNRYSLSTIHKAFYVSLETLLDDLVVQERGLVLIIDWSQFSFQQCRKLSLSVLRSFVDGLDYCYPVRFKAIHCVGQPWYVEAAMSLLKPFLRETSRKKVCGHGNNLSSLHQQIPKEILPSELGGEEGPYQSFKWIENLTNAGDKRLNM